eukprot:Pompholyxophrys_sp_v1_NODE_78_length_2321_cov_1.577670.p1 type:complete len:379 gc:universal NODE_78_length_2321_cov_1.577670:1167-31(-)
MHGCAGIVKKLLSMWLIVNQRREPWSIRQYKEALNMKQHRLCPPSWMTRIPRALTDHATQWKSSEYVNFMLYYGPYVLSDILPEMYYQHFMHLHYMMNIFLKLSISPEDIDRADLNCHRFVFDFEMIYGIVNCVPNIHYISHYADSVKRHGPLWTCSMFPFESANGCLKSLITAKNEVAKSVVNSIMLQNQTYDMVYAAEYVSASFYDAVNRIDPPLALEIQHKVIEDDVHVNIDGCHLSLRMNVAHQTNAECLALRRLVPDVIVSDVRYFQKLIWQNETWACCRDHKRNDSVVSVRLHNNTIVDAIIERFAVWGIYVIVYIAPLISALSPNWCPSTYRSYSRATANMVLVPHHNLQHVNGSIITPFQIHVFKKCLHA